MMNKTAQEQLNNDEITENRYLKRHFGKNIPSLGHLPVGAYMSSHRSFLNSMFDAGVAPATAKRAAAQTPAAKPAPRRMIVDAQVHL